ncbi:hydantoinase/oxoprolinase family protein [Ottowia thiooxydans]|uniref:N-methylhydantoinase A n=1 Tax=Ottowia thiooxydans TaxID=219182 RepID=A0ABV2Q4P1_9BURK
MAFRLACDVGGTFTDVAVRQENGEIVFAKVATTPRDPVEGVLNGIAALAQQLGQDARQLLSSAGEFVHGTTIATNVLAQGQRTRLGLLTTRGFRDVLELRDGTRADRYRLRVPMPQPLVERPNRFEVTERMGYDGSVLIPLDEGQAREALLAVLARGVEAIVVGLLHAHRNPAHELLLEKWLRESGWTGPISLSHRVLPQQGEYIRFSTAAIEASVAPVLQSYLERLGKRLEETAGQSVRTQVMQSSGGLLPLTAASDRAAHFVNSGPAGGAIASANIARQLGRDVVAFDVGGTTTDISVVLEGQAQERLLTSTDAYVIGLPTIDINVLSLGGGSIARVGADGVLQVGPESAQAVPGPASYGRGGMRATLTDAAVVLGFLPNGADSGLGETSGLTLSKELAAAAITSDVAIPLGLSLEAAAEAVVTLAATVVAAGVRAATVGKGIDPRDMALVGFGGAGGLLLGAVAREIGAAMAVAPTAGSVLSAAGFLDAEIRFDTIRHIGLAMSALPASQVVAIVKDMQGELARWQSRHSTAGALDLMDMAWIAECRYAKQAGTVPVPLNASELQSGTMDGLAARFEARYQALFGHAHRDEACVLDTLRLVATQSHHMPERPQGGMPAKSRSRSASRSVHQSGEWRSWPVVDVGDVSEATAQRGPLLCDCGGVIVVREDETLVRGGRGLLLLSVEA